MLTDWLKSVIDHWQTLVTGGVITALLTVAQSKLGISLPWSVNKWIWIIFLIAALFLSWRDERTTIARLESDLANERENNRPELIGEIDQTVVGMVPHGPMVVHLLLNIINAKAPSIVRHWEINIIRNGQMQRCPLETIAANTRLGFDGQPSISLGPNDAIYEKTMNPIPRGGIVRGWLRTSINGMSPEEVGAEGTTWRIDFEDFAGAKYQAIHVIKRNDRGAPLYYPQGAQ